MSAENTNAMERIVGHMRDTLIQDAALDSGRAIALERQEFLSENDLGEAEAHHKSAKSSIKKAATLDVVTEEYISQLEEAGIKLPTLEEGRTALGSPVVYGEKGEPSIDEALSVLPEKIQRVHEMEERKSRIKKEFGNKPRVIRRVNAFNFTEIIGSSQSESVEIVLRPDTDQDVSPVKDMQKEAVFTVDREPVRELRVVESQEQVTQEILAREADPTVITREKRRGKITASVEFAERHVDLRMGPSTNAYKILEKLTLHIGEAVPVDEIAAYTGLPPEQVAVYIRALRDKVEGHIADPKIIETIKGSGYRLNPEVQIQFVEQQEELTLQNSHPERRSQDTEQNSPLTDNPQPRPVEVIRVDYDSKNKRFGIPNHTSEHKRRGGARRQEKESMVLIADLNPEQWAVATMVAAVNESGDNFRYTLEEITNEIFEEQLKRISNERVRQQAWSDFNTIELPKILSKIAERMIQAQDKPDSVTRPRLTSFIKTISKQPEYAGLTMSDLGRVVRREVLFDQISELSAGSSAHTDVIEKVIPEDRSEEVVETQGEFIIAKEDIRFTDHDVYHLSKILWSADRRFLFELGLNFTDQDTRTTGEILDKYLQDENFITEAEGNGHKLLDKLSTFLSKKQQVLMENAGNPHVVRLLGILAKMQSAEQIERLLEEGNKGSFQ